MNLWSVSERKWALESEAKSKIEILELISVPKHSRDSFILIIFNTLSSWREIISVHGS